MSTLERRYGRLLRAYPASYRKERGEEILGTLLEAAPDGQAWPSVRDTQALILGGLRAQAAQHKRLSMGADVRIAVLLGLAVYLAAAATTYLDDFLYGELAFGMPSPGQAAWSVLATGLLAVVVVAAWLARRRAVVAVSAAAAAAALACFQRDWSCAVQLSPACYSSFVSAGSIASLSVCLAAVAVLAGRSERPARSWLWLIGLVVAAGVLPGLSLRFSLGTALIPAFLVLVLVASIAWIAIDARPAIGLATYLVLATLQETLQSAQLGLGVLVPYAYLVIAAVIAAPAVWRLRRQSARPRQAAP